LLRKLVAGGSEDTVITRAHSGKPCRVIRSEWIDAWSAPGAPEPLGMPAQQALTGEAFTAMHEHGDERVIYEAAGQSVFAITGQTSVAQQMQTLVSQAEERLAALCRPGSGRPPAGRFGSAPAREHAVHRRCAGRSRPLDSGRSPGEARRRRRLRDAVQVRERAARHEVRMTQ